MKFPHHLVDIELTNRCNALCSFCPRDRTPLQGFITEENFFKAVERVVELPQSPKITLTGQGEPTLHPNLVQFVQHLTDENLRSCMTTNGSLLTPELAEGVLAAGLKEINFSMSDFEADYEEVYNLDFSNSLANILHFIEINKERCEVTVNIVEHDINREHIPAMKAFWLSKGIKGFLHFGQSNRGGACENGNLFIDTSEKIEQAELLMRERNISTLCDAAFKYLFVGWSGHYYVCCNDYEKTTPLGHVDELGFTELNSSKLELLACGGIQACLNCDLDPTNRIREAMLERDQGLATEAQVEHTLAEIYRKQQENPEMHSDLDWKANVLEQQRGLLARS